MKVIDCEPSNKETDVTINFRGQRLLCFSIKHNEKLEKLSKNLLHAKDFTSDKYVKRRLSKGIIAMKQGTPPLSAIKSIKLVPLNLYYLLDRLTHSGNQHDLIAVNNLCNNEYIQIMSAMNEFYRFLAIGIVFLVNLFTFYAFVDTYYYFNLWT